MAIDLILLSLGILAVTISSLTDIKTREVPDWVSYGLIVSGLGVRGIGSLVTGDYGIIGSGLIGLGILFVIANLMYYTKQWGGGDSKLLMGIGASFGVGLNLSFIAEPVWPFFFTFLLNLFIVGSFYGLFFAFILALLNHKELWKEIKKQDTRLIKASWIFIPAMLGLSFLSLEGTLLLFAIAMAFFAGFLIHTLFFVKIVEKVGLQKWTPVEKLTEGDWVLNPVKVGSLEICKPSDLGLDSKQIQLLKKYKIKKVLVKNGIPFIPSFFIALAISLIWGNLFLMFF